jgi:SAM-dependent methyltransferase
LSDANRRAEDREFFRERYGRVREDASRLVERTVLGHEVGLNGFTTVQQAEELVAHLALAPGRTLLDLGAGRGWPGSYLAQRSGCRVVLADIPLEALRDARVYSESRDVHERAWAVASEGEALPFPPECFDAIVHADVFC